MHTTKERHGLGQMNGEETVWLLEAFHRMGYYNPDPAQLARGLQDVALKKYKTGTVLMRQGDPAETVYIVRKGRLAVSRRLRDDTEVRVAELDEYQVAGEMALVERRQHAFTVKVTQDAELFVLSRKDFEFLMGSCEVFQQIIDTLVTDRKRFNSQALGD